MNLFQALEWLWRNRGKELDAHYDITYRVRLSGTLEMFFAGEWGEWTPDFPNAARYSFVIPERKLPELPEPYRWARNGKGDLEIVDGAGEFECRTISTVDDYEALRLWHALRAATIEEFETRPK